MRLYYREALYEKNFFFLLQNLEEFNLVRRKLKVHKYFIHKRLSQIVY
jgi:hypothetical protein